MNYFLTGFAAGFETGFATGFATGFEVAMVERLLSTSFIPLFGSFVVNWRLWKHVKINDALESTFSFS